MSEQVITATTVNGVFGGEQLGERDLETPRSFSFCPPYEGSQPHVIADTASERLRKFAGQTDEPSFRFDFLGVQQQTAEQIFWRRLPSILHSSSHTASSDVILEADFEGTRYHKDVTVTRLAFRFGKFIVSHQTMDYEKETVSSTYEIRREEL